MTWSRPAASSHAGGLAGKLESARHGSVGVSKIVYEICFRMSRTGPRLLLSQTLIVPSMRLPIVKLENLEDFETRAGVPGRQRRLSGRDGRRDASHFLC